MSLFEIDPDGSDTEGTRLRALPSGLSSPFGMTVYEGRLLIADGAGPELWEIDPDGSDTQGTLLRDLPSGLTAPRAMTWLPPPAVPVTVNSILVGRSITAAVTIGQGQLQIDGIADIVLTGLSITSAVTIGPWTAPK